MLTPQEVSSHAFPKAVMGGYNMSAVDEFLDELTDDYTSLYKENATLKAKLKVLVEKVEDYRATEDSMRATLLTAQKMADSIVKEAEQKRDQMLSQTESDARTRIGQLQSEAAAAQSRMKEGRRKLADFIENARAACTEELNFLNQLPDLPVEEDSEDSEDSEEPDSKAQETDVGKIEENVLASFDKKEEDAAEFRQPEKKAEEAFAPVTEEPKEEQSVPKSKYPEENPFEEDSHVEEPTRRINLNELKFGRNYSDAKGTGR